MIAPLPNRSVAVAELWSLFLGYGYENPHVPEGFGIRFAFKASCV